jgi:hypothetical protein
VKAQTTTSWVKVNDQKSTNSCFPNLFSKNKTKTNIRLTMSSVAEEQHSSETDEYSFVTATDCAAQERSSLEDEDWEFLSENHSVSTMSSTVTTATMSYKDALLFQQNPSATTTTGTSRSLAPDKNHNFTQKRRVHHQTTKLLEDVTTVDDPASSMYDFAKTDRRPNNHTMRRNVSGHDAAQRRKLMGPLKVMDKDHLPLTKTWGCKLFEHRSGRQWLQKERRHEKHVDRKRR